jgi:hypothetical protein
MEQAGLTTESGNRGSAEEEARRFRRHAFEKTA